MTERLSIGTSWDCRLLTVIEQKIQEFALSQIKKQALFGGEWKY